MRGSIKRWTLAAVLEEPGKPLVIRELKVPDPAPGQVLVQVAYSGVCRSQWLEVRGHRGPDRFLPHTLGHEGSGCVVGLGDGVRKVKPGDHVVLSWIKGSGAEVPSTQYQSAAGIVNSGAISTFMRYALISENRVNLIPASMPLREAALFGCALPTGIGIVRNTASVKPGSSVAIFGAGGVGLSALLGARLAGASSVIVVDVVAPKLELARSMGATHTIDGSHQDPVEAIRELTEGRGVDYSVEAAGRPRSMEAAFRSVRDGGGLCVLAGNVRTGERIRLDPFGLIRGKRLVGSWGGECQPDRDIPHLVTAFLEGALSLERMITHEFPLDHINQALNNLENRSVGRALLDMATLSALPSS